MLPIHIVPETLGTVSLQFSVYLEIFAVISSISSASSPSRVPVTHFRLFNSLPLCVSFRVLSVAFSSLAFHLGKALSADKPTRQICHFTHSSFHL